MAKKIIDKPRTPKHKIHPNSLANLRPAHNAAGRPPKAVCITSWLKEYATKGIAEPIDAKNLTYAQAAALSAWKAAAKGDLPEYNFIIERIEGKLAQGLDVTSKGNEIKQAICYNIINPDTKVLIERLSHGGRQTAEESNGNLPQEPVGLPQPSPAAKS